MHALRVPLTVALAALLLALIAALPVAAQDASGGDCAEDGASPALAVISMAPQDSEVAAENVTYLRSPFITFSFPCADAAAELTALTLDGADVLDSVVRAGSRSWVLRPSDLRAGKHSVVYSAEDDAGNAVEGVNFLFRVLEIPPYRIPLYPGWNLLSFPWDIYEPEIGSVIGPEMQADTVLGYSNGD